jgi:hypothetical protein
MQSSFPIQSISMLSLQSRLNIGETVALQVVNLQADSACLKFQVDVPGYDQEPSAIFTYPSHMADLYMAAIEQIHVPGKTVAPLQTQIQVAPKHTGAKVNGSLAWKVYRGLTNVFQTRPTLELPDQYIFDARFDADSNISHILENIATPVFLAQKVISNYLNKDIKIQVIVRKRVSKLALETYETLQIPLICTDDNVYGNVVEISLSSANLRSLQSQLLNIDFHGYTPVTPERVFIPRRGNRQLINNDEVTQFLEQRGFTTIYFEDLTPSQEWSITRNAKVAVVVHGAGTYNFVFNRTGMNQPPGSGLQLIEIFSPCFALTGCRHFASLLNGKWCAVRGQVTPKVLRYLDFDDTPRNVIKSPIKDPFRVDLGSLERALDYLNV